MERKRIAEIAAFALIITIIGTTAGTIIEFASSGDITYEGPLAGAFVGFIIGIIIGPKDNENE